MRCGKISSSEPFGLGSVGSEPKLKEKAGEENLWACLTSLVARYVWSFQLACPEKLQNFF